MSLDPQQLASVMTALKDALGAQAEQTQLDAKASLENLAGNPRIFNEVYGALADVVQNPSNSVARRNAIISICLITKAQHQHSALSKTTSIVKVFANDADISVARAALSGIAEMGQQAANQSIPEVLRALSHSDLTVRLEAAKTAKFLI